MSEIICQERLPFLSWEDPRTARLPGVLPLESENFLTVDEAFAGQMALRDRLVARDPKLVADALPEAAPAVDELLARVLALLAASPGYEVGAHQVRRPDGVVVTLDGAPMQVLARLVQEDLCLMERRGEEHVLTAASLCFPASWTLAEKLGRPLTGIHRPVRAYDDGLARRVQRLFDAVRPGQGLWRMNALIYRDPHLHQPRREADPRTDRSGGSYVRSERQTVLRLPQSEAVLFAIHTWVVRRDSLPADAVARLEAREAAPAG